jgi:Ca-activated chloride channel family protein
MVTAGATSTQQALFRSTTRVVPVATTVVDAQGRLVPGLPRDEFTLLDNGKLQEITYFRNDVQPFTVVVMLDYSASMTASLELLKAAAEEFLLRLLPADRGQVGAFSDTIRFSGEYTSDRANLVSALHNLPFGDSTRLYDAINESIVSLRGIDGRRVVVIFTDGDDTASDVGFNDVLDRAREAGVMVAAIRLEADDVSGGRHRARRHRPLERLAIETGGAYFELRRSNELAPTFTRIAQELHSEYTLGFSPPTLDGREHRLAVRMRQGTMKARARRSYLASRDGLTSTE